MDPNDLLEASQSAQSVWPIIQTVIQTVVPSSIYLKLAGLSLRKKPSEWEKIRDEEMGKIAKDMLDAGELSPMEFFGLKNMAAIAEKADIIWAERQQNEKGQDSTPLEEIDIDWFVRYYEDASKVSNEKMQKIWAGILAGEVVQPGSFSKRTLDVVRNMSASDAVCFEEISQYVVSSSYQAFIYSNNSIHKQHGISFAQLMQLQECGLIHADSTLERQGTVDPSSPALVFREDDLVCTVSTTGKDVYTYGFPIYSLTSAGIELLSVARTGVNRQFVANAVRALSSEAHARSELGNFSKIAAHPEIKFTLHRFISSTGQNVQYDLAPLNLESAEFQPLQK